MEKKHFAENIKNLANSTGIDVVGFTDASEFTEYMLPNSQRRNPSLQLSNAKSIIIAGIYIGGLALPKWNNPYYGRTSRLFLSQYFLDVVKPLEPIAEFLKSEGYQAIICDGTNEHGSVLPLKLAAIRAGLGWQGKHSLLISKKFGTFLALGGLITSADLEHNINDETNQCRKCDKCQVACPLDALEQPYVLNVEKCMSNSLSDENLPAEINSVMENRIIDCEICQQVCPWDKKHLSHPLETDLTKSFKKEIEDWENFFHLPDLVKLSEKEYRQKLGYLSTNIPFDLFHRNVLIAMENAKKYDQIVIES